MNLILRVLVGMAGLALASCVPAPSAPPCDPACPPEESCLDGACVPGSSAGVSSGATTGGWTSSLTSESATAGSSGAATSSGGTSATGNSSASSGGATSSVVRSSSAAGSQTSASTLTATGSTGTTGGASTSSSGASSGGGSTSSGGGLCGATVHCDDGNPCTADRCDAALGCVHDAVTGPCSDGDACTGADRCENGICVGEAVTCDDGLLCTTDRCAPQSGCEHVPNGLACGPAGCGDGTVVAGEGCDDGNGIPGDGCDQACQLEACGNGIPQVGERCDDANDVDGDGCSAACALETCGDGNPDVFEDCDDGNGVPGDGCDPQCRPEVCGNGVLQQGEACDDGNTAPGDGCDGTCAAEPCAAHLMKVRTSARGYALGWSVLNARGDVVAFAPYGTYASGADTVTPLLLSAGPHALVIDDLSTEAHAGEAELELVSASGTSVLRVTRTGPGKRVLPFQAQCAAWCGDGLLQLDRGERCDGATASLGGVCDATCAPRCGNGSIDPGEACDGAAGCTADCSAPGCGDGTVGAGEGCDDGNNVAGDGCSPACQPEICGDDVVQRAGGEVCDGPAATCVDCTQHTCLPHSFEVFGGANVDAAWSIVDELGVTVASGEAVGSGRTALPLWSGRYRLVTTGASWAGGAWVLRDANGSAVASGSGPLPTEASRSDWVTLECLTQACGDGVVTAPEACDDGNRSSGDGCSAECRAESCGDGVVQAGRGERCEPALNGSACSAECTVLACQPYTVTVRTLSGGRHVGWEIRNAADTVVAAAEPGTLPSHSTRTVSVSLPAEPHTLLLRAANGGGWQGGQLELTDVAGRVLVSGTLAYGFVAAVPFTPACVTEWCGDGVIQATQSEVCDDGNRADDDACSAACLPQWCGDGLVQPGLGEVCDDGNENDGDGCDGACLPEVCGDGDVYGVELCDDGNTTSGDGCSDACIPEICGDGVLHPALGEQCDDGNNAPGDRCDAGCQLERCGDGVVQAVLLEACDDGNTDEDDGCGATCLVETCGDGVIQPTLLEQCDLGDADDGDGCTASCRFEACAEHALRVTTLAAGGEVAWTLRSLGDARVVSAPPGGYADNAVETRAVYLPSGGYRLEVAPSASAAGARITLEDRRGVTLTELLVGPEPGAVDVLTDCWTAWCGDGEMQAGEDCDDWNRADDDGCSAGCHVETCGDGAVQAGRDETCDDGNIATGDGCDDDCHTEVCGNGIPQAGEECDDGNVDAEDGCGPTCAIERCGDGVVQSGEACDDGNENIDDGCTPLCAVETCGGYRVLITPGDFTAWTIADGAGMEVAARSADDSGATAVETPVVLLPGTYTMTVEVQANRPAGAPAAVRVQVREHTGDDVLDDMVGWGDQRTFTFTTSCVLQWCGDGVLRPEDGEACDDGNRDDEDGCSFGCAEESCGDGVTQAALGETCDDGDTIANDGCGPTCRLEVCGDALPHAGEACDDGNGNSGDGCDVGCRLEQGFTCAGAACTPICGDRLLRGGETCDDGDDLPGDGCADDCRIETGWTCPAAGCAPICGDGAMHGAEECDDNNTAHGDGCSELCRIERCGDGVRQAALGEACDDGNVVADDGCGSSCLAEVCGDGTTQPSLGESCDDGNTTAGDGCDARCVSEVCGNGLRQAAEECDDGATANGDGCDGSCRRERCGNGTVQFGEQCDDGNDAPGDGCDRCVLEGCGNGILEAGEECDDVDPTPGDGCDADCRLELCGNGLTQPGEDCDDGNFANGDGCDTDCVVEECGNGRVQVGESCDDGNTDALDGCSVSCSRETCAPHRIIVSTGADAETLGWHLLTPEGDVAAAADTAYDDNQSYPQVASLWMGAHRFVLESSDGNGWHGGSYRIEDITGATLASGTLPSGSSREDIVNIACRTRWCGDGIIQPDLGETCDDANTTTGDGCGLGCRLEGCGDGVLQAWLGEACDDGNLGGADGCDGECVVEECGNGKLQGTEQCDDGNLAILDGCDGSCQIEPCGNGLFEPWLGEACDDANLLDGDGCTSACAWEACAAHSLRITRATSSYTTWRIKTTDGAELSSGTVITYAGVPTLVPVNIPAGEHRVEIAPEGGFGFMESGTPLAVLDSDGTVVQEEASIAGGAFGFTVKTACGSVCNNGVIGAGEVCDDGNNVAGDGCAADCTSHEACASYSLTVMVDNYPTLAAWTLRDANGVLAGSARYGSMTEYNVPYTTPVTLIDGVATLSLLSADGRGWGEDGSWTLRDAANDVVATGNLTSNSATTTIPIRCEKGCGDGRTQPSRGETCDDGAALPGDGCDGSCGLEACAAHTVRVTLGASGDYLGWRIRNAAGEVVASRPVGSLPYSGTVTDVVNLLDGAHVLEMLAIQDDLSFWRRARVELIDSSGVRLAGNHPDLSTGPLPFTVTCARSCGDGVTQPLDGETCDDGNTATADGCDGCAAEACGGHTVVVTSSASGSSMSWLLKDAEGRVLAYENLETIPPNQVRTLPVQLDDGDYVLALRARAPNTNWAGGTVAVKDYSGATLVSGTLSGSTSLDLPLPVRCVKRCGDGLLATGLGEECEDGNSDSGDGCAECLFEGCAAHTLRVRTGGDAPLGWRITNSSGAVVAEAAPHTLPQRASTATSLNLVDGDYVLHVLQGAGGQAGEVLGELELVTATGARVFHMIPRHGQVGAFPISIRCTAACGDGTVSDPETCEDGNATTLDGCNTCTREVCSTWTVQATHTQGSPDWRIIDADGKVLVWSPYWENTSGSVTMTVQLSPGAYSFETRSENVSWGSGGYQVLDGGGGLVMSGTHTGGYVQTVPLTLDCALGCGDGVLHPTLGETCDDGNAVAGDGCDAQCQFQACARHRIVVNTTHLGTYSSFFVRDGQGQTVFSVPTGAMQDHTTHTYLLDLVDDAYTVETRVSSGGNSWGGGTLEIFDANDVRLVNAAPSDTAFGFPFSASCAAACGDGLVQAAVEACDDGNTDPDDGCSALCELEACAAHRVTIKTAGYGQGLTWSLTDGTGNVVRSGAAGSMGDNATYTFDIDLPDGGYRLALGGYWEGEVRASVEDLLGGARLVDIMRDRLDQSAVEFTTSCAKACGDARVQPLLGESCEDGNSATGDGCGVGCAVEACAAHTVEVTTNHLGAYLGWRIEDAAGRLVAGQRAGEIASNATTTTPVSLLEGAYTLGLRIQGGSGWGANVLRIRDAGGAVIAERTLASGSTGSFALNIACTDCAEACGDGLIQPLCGESCEDGNTVDNDGCSGCAADECGQHRVVVRTTHRGTNMGFNIKDGSGTVRYSVAPGQMSNDTTHTYDVVLLPGAHTVEMVANPSFVDWAGGTLTVEDHWGGTLVTGTLSGVAFGTVPFAATCGTQGCGDGLVQPGLGESCEDGNSVGGDGCSSGCAAEACAAHTIRVRAVSGSYRFGWKLYDASNRVVAQDAERTYNIGTSMDFPVQLLDGAHSLVVTMPFAQTADRGTVEILDYAGGVLAEASLPANSFTLPVSVLCDKDCGDDIVQPGPPLDEDCEDGNYDNGDGCSGACQWEACAAHSVVIQTQNYGWALSWQLEDSQGAILASAAEGSLAAYTTYTIPVNLPDGAYVLRLFEDSGDWYGATAEVREGSGGVIVSGTLAGGAGGVMPFNALCVAGCGDNVTQPGVETCDDGNTLSGDGCSALCQAEYCGDRLLHAGIGEECDDGNNAHGDGCDATCHPEVCGNNRIQAGEECDDGAVQPGDGCGAACQYEPCTSHVVRVIGGADAFGVWWDLLGPGAEVVASGAYGSYPSSATTDVPVTLLPGSYSLVLHSVQDRSWVGNTIQVLGPTGTVLVSGTADVAGDKTLAFGAICIGAFCGDGTAQASEECDDGNQVSGDGCTASCTDEVCGDGIRQAALGEACDDGNTEAGDGCSATCSYEPCSAYEMRIYTTMRTNHGLGWRIDDAGVTVASGSVPNVNRGTTYTWPVTLLPGNHNVVLTATSGFGWGDARYELVSLSQGAVVQAGEMRSSTPVTRALTTVCAPPACGDGLLQAGEECDDGGTDDGDGCAGACTLEACADQLLVIEADYEEQLSWTVFGLRGEIVAEAARGSYAAAPGLSHIEAPLRLPVGNHVLRVTAQGGANATFTVHGRDGTPLVSGSGAYAEVTIPAVCVNAWCGDGVMQPGEECDDGDGRFAQSDDGCDAACVIEYCGDARVQPGLGEECDEGDTLSEDGCSATCQVEICGDGVIQPGLTEECDDGNTDSGDGCSSACVAESCGDGVIQPGLGEECDDGNTASGDGCDSACVVEPCRVYSVALNTSAQGANIGWMLTDGAGNVLKDVPAGSYAAGQWRVEPVTIPDGTFNLVVTTSDAAAGWNGWLQLVDHEGGRVAVVGLSAGQGSAAASGTVACEKSCGDGVRHVTRGEQCDDGNGQVNDGCTPSCQVEWCMEYAVEFRSNVGHWVNDNRWSLVAPPPLRTVVESEYVHSGGTTHLGGANSRRRIQPIPDVYRLALRDGFTPSQVKVTHVPSDIVVLDESVPAGATSVAFDLPLSCIYRYCGNNILEPDLGEVCDDGNRASMDGCRADCGAIEICGDGVLQPPLGEQCDDGNNVYDDGCDPGCQREFCGDGTTQPTTEQCDDGNNLSNDGCSAACVAEVCGDGIRQPGIGEQCDDGNTASDDGCGPTCLRESCGDGVVQVTRETCDDGNVVSEDGCSSACVVERCGDGIVQAGLGEQCDDGNTVSDDGCGGIACEMEPCAAYTIKDQRRSPANVDWVVRNPAGTVVAAGQHFAWNQYSLNETLNVQFPYQGTYQLEVFGSGYDVLNSEVEVTDFEGGRVVSSRSGGGVFPFEVQCRTRCGDGVVQPGRGEVCDDGNDVPGDGCDACQAESCGAIRLSMDAYRDNLSVTLVGPGDRTLLHISPEEKAQLPDSHTVALTLGDGTHTLVLRSATGDLLNTRFRVTDVVGGNDLLNVTPPRNGADYTFTTRCDKGCGDGLVQPLLGETCDDGNRAPEDGCSRLCVPEGCGDGEVQVGLGESCDDGNANPADACASCQFTSCGDGITQRDNHEVCDTPGVSMADSGCAPDCSVNHCAPQLVLVRATQSWEIRDPQGMVVTSGPRTSDFAVRHIPYGTGAYTLHATLNLVNGVYYTGTVEYWVPDPTSDWDANIAGLGRIKLRHIGTASIRMHPDWYWGTPPITVDSPYTINATCRMGCGDGAIQDFRGEVCDDGNALTNDGCVNCQAEGSCGDGVIRPLMGEQCDDGNRQNGDGCDGACRSESCGDGTVQPHLGEQCDDHNWDPTDGCTRDCRINLCGNGVLNAGEECDWAIDVQGCEKNCRWGQCVYYDVEVNNYNVLGTLASIVGSIPGVGTVAAIVLSASVMAYQLSLLQSLSWSIVDSGGNHVPIPIATLFGGAGTVDTWPGYGVMIPDVPASSAWYEALGEFLVRKLVAALNPFSAAALVTTFEHQDLRLKPGSYTMQQHVYLPLAWTFTQIFLKNDLGHYVLTTPDLEDQLAALAPGMTIQTPFTVACEHLCGDGVVQAQAGEQCDDGNHLAADGCDAACQFEMLAMVPLPAGAFTMGAPHQESCKREDLCRDENDPHYTRDEQQHPVYVGAFELGVFEVTYREFQAVMGYMPIDYLPWGSGCSPLRCAADLISWNQAAEFTNRLSASRGLESCYTCGGGVCTERVAPRLCRGYRLPTEAEWEYAARAGGAYTGPIDPEYTLLEQSSGRGNVGTTPANDFGLHDMLGNKGEWVHDWYGAYPTTVNGRYPDTQVNPSGPSSGPYRVWRGGKAITREQDTRFARRFGDPAQDQFHGVYMSFRVARSLLPDEP